MEGIEISNPAIITLDTCVDKKGKLKRFQIEDNIGESIHLHADNIRIDFSVKEFIEFSGVIRESLSELDFFPGYSIDSFDEHFLKECSSCITDLVEIRIEEVRLGDLFCVVRLNNNFNLNINKIVPIVKSPVYQYLKHGKNNFLKYSQYNYLSLDNASRLIHLLESIEKNGYPFLDRYIILFNGQNYIRDGQHRAAILTYLNGVDCVVKVMRFVYKGNNHHLSVFVQNLKEIIRLVCRVSYKALKVLFQSLFRKGL